MTRQQQQQQQNPSGRDEDTNNNPRMQPAQEQQQQQQEQEQLRCPPEAMRRVFAKLDRKRQNLKTKFNEKIISRAKRLKRRHQVERNKRNGPEIWDEMEYAERQNSVATFDLFKYAKLRERLAVIFGLLFMWYAASWQPISVFILAIMASLMGQYSKQSGWLMRLNNTATSVVATTLAPGAASLESGLNITVGQPSPMNSGGGGGGGGGASPSVDISISAGAADIRPLGASASADAPSAWLISGLGQLVRNVGGGGSSSGGGQYGREQLSMMMMTTTTTTAATPAAPSLLRQQTPDYGTDYELTPGEEESQMMAGASLQVPGQYESFSLLAPLYSLVNPIFDLSSSGQIDEQENIKVAVHDILQHESNQFLRKSFEINGSAFLLALTQLLAFFIGMSLITWAAKRQASRVKILYFNSCLHQEVTWFEAIDSASGSGSSLNALVEKYEDGIGMKLALLCYFLGHVALFAITAFYQMFRLASFCMPFVMLVGVVILYLSELQAIAIGENALFAKRSLQLAEEILAAIRTVFAFNGQQKELTRFSMSLQPVYRKSLIKHLYTALNTSLSKFSIFACFSAYCFYAMHLFPPYDPRGPANKSVVLAVMRGAEVSIVNILISIPFMEALQQSKGSIARIYAAIERRSKINASSGKGIKPSKWQPSISFRMVQFGYADRSGPTRRRSTLPFLNLAGSPGSNQSQLQLQQHLQQLYQQANNNNNNSNSNNNGTSNNANDVHQDNGACATRRRQSLIEELADEFQFDSSTPTYTSSTNSNANATGTATAATGSPSQALANTQKAVAISPLTSITGPKCATSDANEPRVHQVAAEAAAAACGQHQQQHQQQRRPSAIRRFMGHEIAGHKSNDKRILNYFNLEIKAGQSVALVGPSGSGKSTILALVQRLYDTTGGQLLIGQHNIKDLNISWLRNQIGVVTQEPRLFDMTIAENIRLGLCDDHDPNWLESDPDSWTSASGGGGGGDSSSTSDVSRAKREAAIMQQVVEASRAASAHEFIVRLPNGYATRVGSGGVQLSGGQKQRIAIARALIRRPKILLLDESTSALDTESESKVQRALRAASVGRTTITVAHRLSTIREVDLIVVMSQGQVVECGSHEELLAMESTPSRPAVYKQMYEEQLKSMRSKQPVVASGGDCAPEQEASSKKLSPLSDIIEFKGKSEACADHKGGAATSLKDECSSIQVEDYEDDDDSDCNYDYNDDEDDDNDDDDEDRESTLSNISDPNNERPSAWQLWQFIEMPKWSALAAALVCLLAGLILPINLIAHSYLFSAFAYNELEQIGDYLYVFGLMILSFSTFVFIVSFLQVILPGYVGEKLSIRLRAKLMDSLLNKPMFYFDMDSNSAGSLCDRLNGYISCIQSIAGTRVATMLEAISTLMAGAIFGFGQNLSLSMFCLSFALLVLLTTIIESRIVQRESSLQQKYDAKLAHLMADALSNIKTIASLNKEKFFIGRFTDIINQREIW